MPPDATAPDGLTGRMAGEAAALLPFSLAAPEDKTGNRAGSAALSSSEPEKKCRINDRFDRKALVAYHWDRNRLALDVDGINLGGSGNKGVRLEYRLRLQPGKTRKEKCLYESNWQGLIGSGYHELFVRENDTVWQELRRMRRDVMHRLDDNF